MVNLAGPRPMGNPIESMDLGFALRRAASKRWRLAGLAAPIAWSRSHVRSTSRSRKPISCCAILGLEGNQERQRLAAHAEPDAATIAQVAASFYGHPVPSLFQPERALDPLFFDSGAHGDHPNGRDRTTDAIGAVQPIAPRRSTTFSATRQALAMIVKVGLAPVPVGNGAPSTT
jgi:hypothetical protein